MRYPTSICARFGRSERDWRPTSESHRHVPWLPLLLCIVFATACQELDPNLATGLSGLGNGPATPAVDGGAVTPDPADGAGSDVVTSSCDTTRSLARSVLATNCAYCHQAPGNSTSVYGSGQFNFILELDKITTLRSNVFTGVSYVEAGDPDHSLIYQRASNGTMPPAGIAQRPSMDDVAKLRLWITSCVDGNSGGWPPPSRDPGATDAGADAATGCGDPGQACCAANVCNNAGCCVAGLCRANGLTCAAPPTLPGSPPLVGLAGTCTNGSCQTAAGASCGNVAEPCCDLMTCTASQSSCLTGMTTCSACGATGQPCCKPNGCLNGRTCINGGVGRVGTCQICGGIGQPCCGAGIAAQQTCNTGLICSSVIGMGNLCSTDGGVAGEADSGGAD